MSSRTLAPENAKTDHAINQYPTREIFVGWFGEPYIRPVPVVPARFIARQGGGWWLKINRCPFCQREHVHGSNLDARWDGSPHDPRQYAAYPVSSHCSSSKQGPYLLEIIISSLPAEALESEAGQ